MFTRQVKVQSRQKYFSHNNNKGKLKSFPSTSFFTDCVFSIFRRKLYGYDQSELDIKLLIPAPTQ